MRKMTPMVTMVIVLHTLVAGTVLVGGQRARDR